MNLHHLSILTISGYIIIALAQGLHLFGKLWSTKGFYYAGSLLLVTTHGWILYKLIDTPQGHNLDWLIMLSFTLWLMNLFTLAMSLKKPIANLCVLTYPASAISVGLALFYGGYDFLATKAPYGVLAHIFISFFAVSLLSMASLQALLLGLQNYLLKHHKPSTMLRILPPLQTMEGLLFVIISSGMLFLSASLMTGFLYQDTLLTAQLFPKIVLALCAWILLTLLLVGRYFFGWRGPTAIRWTLSGTLLIIFSYFGTKALLL
ncbi:MAG: cytochrome c biogenesis protein CcsA [Gammaproteobacteria bacterium]|jgi:ABC-type uncharacterized transport system permease subunit|nr:cytochrome c biogenesis protein CcsA [Gammaproteobacteria bacterium]